jgi:hypothetical protein
MLRQPFATPTVGFAIQSLDALTAAHLKNFDVLKRHRRRNYQEDN